MKNILYGLLATLLFCNFSFAQLMSDAEHKTMMDAYATNLNNELTPYCTQQGITIDQYKRGIVKGIYTLSPTAKSNITNYATQLQTYGAAFATAKGLVANTDALKYFYSTFIPSTVVLGGTIVESTTAPGLTGLEMWTCALKSFNAENCGSSLLIGDENNLSELADISVNILKLPTENPTNPENIGIQVMLNGFGECMQKYFELEKVGYDMSRDVAFSNLTTKLNDFNNQTVVNQAAVDQLIAQETLTTSDLESLAMNLGFQNKAAMDSFQCGIKSNIDVLKGNYISPNITTSEDVSTILNAAERYNANTLSSTEQQAGNVSVALMMGGCAGRPDLSNASFQWSDYLPCLKDAFLDAVGLKFAGFMLNKTIALINGLYDGNLTGRDISGILAVTIGEAVKQGLKKQFTLAWLIVDVTWCILET